ncbi:O-antigen ligase family protein [Chloroflexota bacterium]
MANQASANSVDNIMHPTRNNRIRLLSPLTLLLTLVGIGLVLGGAYIIGATPYGIYALGAVLALVFGLTITLRPAIGVYVLFAFVYLNLSDILTMRLGLPDSNKILFVLLLVGFIANRIVIHHKPIVFRKTEGVILAFGLVMLLSTFLAGNRAVATDRLLDWIKDFAILFLVIQLCGEEQVWKRSQWALIWMALLLASLSAFQVLTGNFEFSFGGLALSPFHQIVGEFDNARVSGPIGDPNFYAQILLMVLPLAAYRLFDPQEKSHLRIVGGFSSLMIVAVVVFTYSRSAFVAMFLLGLLIALERQFNPYKIAVVGVVAILVFMPFIPAGYMDRLETLTDILTGNNNAVQTELSFRGRSSEMIIAGQMFADKPLLGVGPGNYAVNYLDYSANLGLDSRLENRQAHSLYLEIAAEMGILGILTFITMLIVVFVGTRRAKKLVASINRADLHPWISAVQYSLTGYLLTSIFLHGDYTRYLWLIIALAVSCSVLAEQLVANHQSQQQTLEAREI